MGFKKRKKPFNFSSFLSISNALNNKVTFTWMERRHAWSVATAPYSSFGFSPIAPFDRREKEQAEEMWKLKNFSSGLFRVNSIWRYFHLRSWTRKWYFNVLRIACNAPGRSVMCARVEFLSPTVDTTFFQFNPIDPFTEQSCPLWVNSWPSPFASFASNLKSDDEFHVT